MGHKKSKWLELISQINWLPTFALIVIHSGAIYGSYLSITSGKWQTIIFGYILGNFNLIFEFVIEKKIFKRFFMSSIFTPL
jgi:hypothetical protein